MTTLYRFLLAVCAVAFALGLNFASAAWVNPPVGAPGANIAVPLNVGTSAQTKSGTLGADNALGASWNSGTSQYRFNVMGATGRVGIGNNAPTEMLDVTGNIKSSGNITAASFLYSSDRNLKKNINILDPNQSLKQVLALDGVSFNWKDGGEASDGLIAQEVEKIYPELVHTDATTGLKSVNYAALTGPMIQALKAQQEQIDELKTEVKALKVH